MNSGSILPKGLVFLRTGAPLMLKVGKLAQDGRNGSKRYLQGWLSISHNEGLYDLEKI